MSSVGEPTQKTILIVEDDPFLVRMYETKFTSEGFNVITADNGVDGLELALSKKPTLIILDVMMPGLSGIDMLRRLRQSESGKETPVIVLSNLSQEDEIREANALGVKEYLIKANLTPKEVIEKVKKYL